MTNFAVLSDTHAGKHELQPDFMFLINLRTSKSSQSFGTSDFLPQPQQQILNPN